MGVEAAMGQADLVHDLGDARAVVPSSPSSARGGRDDPFVGDFLAAGGGPPGGGSAHMMSIIYQSGSERKTVEAPPGLDRAEPRTLLIQSQACCQLHQGALFTTYWDRDGQANLP